MTSQTRRRTHLRVHLNGWRQRDKCYDSADAATVDTAVDVAVVSVVAAVVYGGF